MAFLKAREEQLLEEEQNNSGVSAPGVAGAPRNAALQDQKSKPAALQAVLAAARNRFGGYFRDDNQFN